MSDMGYDEDMTDGNSWRHYFIRSGLEHLLLPGQIGNLCVPTSLAYIDDHVFGGNMTVDNYVWEIDAAMIEENYSEDDPRLDIQTYGTPMVVAINFATSPVARDLLNNNFYWSSVDQGDFVSQLDAGNPILISCHWPDDQIGHEMVIIGYEILIGSNNTPSNSNFMYEVFDPQDGGVSQLLPSYLYSITKRAYAISGIK